MEKNHNKIIYFVNNTIKSNLSKEKKLIKIERYLNSLILKKKNPIKEKDLIEDFFKNTKKYNAHLNIYANSINNLEVSLNKFFKYELSPTINLYKNLRFRIKNKIKLKTNKFDCKLSQRLFLENEIKKNKIILTSILSNKKEYFQKEYSPIKQRFYKHTLFIIDFDKENWIVQDTVSNDHIYKINKNKFFYIFGCFIPYSLN